MPDALIRLGSASMNLLLNIPKQYRAKVLFTLAGLLWIGFAYLVMKRKFFELLAIPIPMVVVAVTFDDFRKLWYLLIFFLPISFNLEGLLPGVRITFPTDLICITLMLLVIFKIVSERKWFLRFYGHPISIMLLLWFVWQLFTVIGSSMPGVSLKWVVAFLWMAAAFFFLSVLIFREEKNILWFFWLIGFAFVLVMLTILFLYVKTGRNPFGGLRFNPMPFFNDHTVFGAFTATMVPIFFLFTFSGKFSRNYRILAAGVLFFFLLGLYLSYSRGAWMSMIAGMGLMGLFVIRRFLRRIAPLLLVGAAGLGIWLLTHNTGTDIRNDAISRKTLGGHVKSITNFKTDDSNAERVNRWKCALRMWEERPMLGWGPGTYAMLYGDFQRGVDRTLISTNRGDNGTAHNEFLLALSESGTIGMSMMLLFFIVPIWFGLRGYIKARAPNVRILYLGVTFGIVIYFIHAFVNNFLDQDKIGGTLFGFFAVIVALDIFWLKREKEEALRRFKSGQEGMEPHEQG